MPLVGIIVVGLIVAEVFGWLPRPPIWVLVAIFVGFFLLSLGASAVAEVRKGRNRP